MQAIRRYFGQHFVHIADSNFMTSGDEYAETVDALKYITNMRFSVNLRPDYAPREMVEMLYKSGVIEFLFGIESASDIVLKAMRKAFRFIDVVETLRNIQRLGIPFIGSYWIVGHPGETHKTAIETLEGLRYLYDNELLFNSYSNVYVPLPGTEPFENPKKSMA